MRNRRNYQSLSISVTNDIKNELLEYSDKTYGIGRGINGMFGLAMLTLILKGAEVDGIQLPTLKKYLKNKKKNKGAKDE